MATQIWDEGPGADESGGPPEIMLYSDATTVEEARRELIEYCKRNDMEATADDSDGSVYVVCEDECWEEEVTAADLAEAVASHRSIEL